MKRILSLLFCLILSPTLANAVPSARQALDAGSVKGGLVVHLGCGDGELLVELAALDMPLLVQGLDADEKNVAAARARIRKAGLAGKVTVRQLDGDRLPYVDGLVNALIVDGAVSADEQSRVLSPGGVTLVGKGAKWSATTKPRPDSIDDWTHFLHGPGNNAVAQDTEVGTPRTLRWDCGPRYSRSHEMDVSIAASVTEGGRLISIVDKGPAGILGKGVPDKWMLEARDAFSGVLLWERPMGQWSWRDWKPELTELEDWTGLIAQRRLVPATLPRRLAAVDGKVYVTFGVNAHVTALDAATGKTIREYMGTKGTDEIVVEGGQLIAAARPQVRETALAKPDMTLKQISSRKPMPVREDGRVVAVDLESGENVWETTTKTVLPFTLAIEGDRAFYHTGDELVCLDRRAGQEAWKVANKNVDSNRWDVRHVLLVHDGVILLTTPKTKLQAIDAKTGAILWEGKGGRGAAFKTSPVEVFVIDGLVWFTDGKQVEGKDLRTGEVKRSIDLPKYFHTPGHHLRCYRARATSRYILDNKRGIEFMDVTGESHQKNDWVRGACRYGVLPANGLVYSTPTPCSCYQTVLLKGFNALSDAMPPEAGDSELVKGPAYGKTSKSSVEVTDADWPMLRANTVRNGVSSAPVAAKISRAWKRDIGGKLTQPIVVGDRLYVSSRETNTLAALNAKDGAVVWTHVAPAEIDSPPAYHNGALVFGGRDGWVTCLRASDGELAWRFRAAPMERQIVSYDRLESSWPVIGAPLVLADGKRAVAYVAAGRNSYLDGGIHLAGIDVATGEALYRHRIANPAQDNLGRYAPHEMEGAQPDVMVFDGKHISMQSKVFDRELKPVDQPAAPHLYASGGFLDDQAWHRNFWMLAPGWAKMNKNAPTFPNVGQLLVHDSPRVYGVKYFTKHQGQSMVFYPEDQGYYLFCDDDSATYNSLLNPPKDANGKPLPVPGGNHSTVKKWEEHEARVWQSWIPVRTRAMVKAGDTLLIAGPADKIDEADPMAVYDGRAPGELWAVDTKTGKTLTKNVLDTSPVFDGMIAAQGKMFVALTNGVVECWE